MKFDAKSYTYPSVRRVVYGRRGMVCTSQPLAAQAGLDVLKAGGNAIDAAIATAACMTVLEPTSNGLGSDAFAIVCTADGRLWGLNASGPAPKALTADSLRAAGHETMPALGWGPVTVPGAVGGWAALRRRFGKKSMEELLAPAISYAREGFPVSPVISELWSRGEKLFTTSDKLTAGQRERWAELFLRGEGSERHAPKAGEIFSSEAHAETLEELARTDCESFYRGGLAQKIDAVSREEGGWLRAEDLAAFEPEWVEPIHIDYKGHEIWELPPNGIGIIALMTLNLLKDRDYPQGRDSEEVIHRQLEAMKLAFADGNHFITDPRDMAVTAEQLLSDEYTARRRELLGDTAAEPAHGDPNCGGTVYLCTADSEGNMVSYIQSNFRGFGSGLVVPGTGIALHNRGSVFSLDETAYNCVKPGKKPFHTIIPGFLTEKGRPVGPFGVMGAYMQPQGHVQVMMNTIDFHLNPQQALDAPRWQWIGGKTVELEPGADPALAEALRRRGHEVRIAQDSISFGRGQIIWRDEQGVLCGATEPRTDGTVAVW